MWSNTRRSYRWTPLLALLLVVAGCFGIQFVDMTNVFYGGNSLDTGQALITSQGYIYTAGGTYGRYGVARIGGVTGQLAPGSGSTSWGHGIDSNPTASPVGWVAFQPGTGSNQAAASMAYGGGQLFVTGPADAGNSAGFATISLADGSVSNIRRFRPRDIHSAYGGGLGASPGGDIFVVGSHAYVFGHASAANPVPDVIWVGQRTLTGTNPFTFGDACPNLNPAPGCPLGGLTGYRLLSSGYSSAAYRDTSFSGSIAYSIVRTSNGTEGRIMVTSLDLASANPPLTIEFEDGSATSTFQPTAIVAQSDGKLLVAGYEGSAPNTSMFVIRYDSSGARDSTFGSSGKVDLDLTASQDRITDLELLADGRIMAIGASGSDAVAIRFLTDGSLDTSFTSTGYQLFPVQGRTTSFVALEIGQRIRAVGAASTSQVVDMLIVDMGPTPP